MLPKMVGDTWRYLKTSEVLKAAGLHTIVHYVQVRRESIMRWIVDRLILWICEKEERRHGTTPCTFWWEQPMELEAASAGAPAVVAAEGDGGGGPRTP